MPSTENDARVDELRQHLATATKLSDVFDYFEHELTGSPEFMAACRPQAKKALAELVEAAVARALGGATRLKQVMCLRYLNSDLFHGAAYAGEAMIMFLWFDMTKQGLVVVTLRTGKTDFLRLTGVELPAGIAPAHPPSGEAS